jgi:hypothetical protein
MRPTSYRRSAGISFKGARPTSMWPLMARRGSGNGSMGASIDSIHPTVWQLSSPMGQVRARIGQVRTSGNRVRPASRRGARGYRREARGNGLFVRMVSVRVVTDQRGLTTSAPVSATRGSSRRTLHRESAPREACRWPRRDTSSILRLLGVARRIEVATPAPEHGACRRRVATHPLARAVESRERRSPWTSASRPPSMRSRT